MYVKPPGMAAQDGDVPLQHPADKQQASRQTEQQPAQEGEAPKRRHGPKEQWERGQGTYPCGCAKA